MNLVVLVGRLAQDPKMRTTANGHSICTFSIAVDRRYGSQGQQTADFINVVAWNRQAEVICQYLGKGRQIAIQGRLQSRSYQTQDGSKRYVTEVVLESFDFIGSRSDNSGQNRYNQDQNYNQNNYNQSNNYNQNNSYNQNGNYNNDYNNDASMNQNQQDRLEIDDDFSLLADDDEVPF